MSGAILPPVFASRFAVSMDVSALVREVEGLDDSAWVQHVDAENHNGGWDSAALVSQAGGVRSLSHDAERASDRVDSTKRWLEHCPSLASFLARWPCQVTSAWLLRLRPGGVLRKLGEFDPRQGDGEARLLAPLSNIDGAEFYIEQTLVKMVPGECWYFDFSRVHRLQNLGTTPQLFLILDCPLNSWLESAVGAGALWPRTSSVEAPLSGPAQFELFRERAFADETLLQALRETKEMNEFLARTVAEGAARGFVFSPEDVRAHCNRARRDWIEQWIV